MCSMRDRRALAIKLWHPELTICRLEAALTSPLRPEALAVRTREYQVPLGLAELIRAAPRIVRPDDVGGN